jgi:transcriptional regulator with XRE-family HTH domain
VGLGWRAADLAEASGVGSATIARFELGQPVSTDSIAKLEAALAKEGAQFSRRSGRIGVTVAE